MATITDGAHKIPDGYTLEQITLSEEALTTAAAHTLKEMFELGVFENPYRDPQTAKEVIANPVHWEHADDVHRKSVVLLKNKEQLLPLTAEKTCRQKNLCKRICIKEETASAYRKTAQHLSRNSRSDTYRPLRGC